MSKTEEKEVLLQRLQELGYVTTQEACEITGRSPCGATNKFFADHNVRRVSLGSATRSPIMWNKADLEKLPKKTKEAPPAPVSDKDAGQYRLVMRVLDSVGKRLQSLETRMAVIESYIEAHEAAVEAASMASGEEPSGGEVPHES